MNGSVHFESAGAPMAEVTRRSLALLAGFELGRETAREGMVSGAGDCCRHRLCPACWRGRRAEHES